MKAFHESMAWCKLVCPERVVHTSVSVPVAARMACLADSARAALLVVGSPAQQAP